MKKLIEKLVSLFSMGREGLWERLDFSEKTNYTVAMFHNGRRPVYQILRLDGSRWKIVGPAMPSAAWAQVLLKKYRNEESVVN